jgi:hypothetical protein
MFALLYQRLPDFLMALDNTPVFVFDSRTAHTKMQTMRREKEATVQTSSTDSVAYKQTPTTTTSFHSYQHRI